MKQLLRNKRIDQEILQRKTKLSDKRRNMDGNLILDDVKIVTR